MGNVSYDMCFTIHPRTGLLTLLSQIQPLKTLAMTILRTTAITPDHPRCACRYRPATWGNFGLTQIFIIIFLIQNEANPNP